jgi:hypothetical protein
MTPLLTLNREIESNRGILGTIYTADGDEVCKTLELPWERNMRNVSCIPWGQYTVTNFTSVKYPEAFVVLDVPGRSGILIHAGNFISDIEGCILVGKEWEFMGHPRQLAVSYSKNTLNRFLAAYPMGFKLEIV